MNEGCPAIIVINGEQYQCHMETAEGWHVGKMHSTRVETSPSFIDGFEWGIDEQGNVFFNMNASVALCVVGPQTIHEAISHIGAMAKDLSFLAYEAGKCDGRSVTEDSIPF